MSDAARRLCLSGAILFFLGLVNGALLSALENPRLGLSAHLTAVQSGMALVLFGLLWPHLRLAPGPLRLAERASILSLYALWLALLLGAVLGTSGATPLAGAGFAGTTAEEALVTALLYAGSAGILLGTGLVIRGLVARGKETA